jgi:hypothetical protein
MSYTAKEVQKKKKVNSKMSRVEYRSKRFPELAKLRMQARGLGLLQGKKMEQVFSEALQLWIEHNSYSKQTGVN